MCGCSAGRASAPSARIQSFTSSSSVSNEPCTYELSQVQDWLDKANCFKSNGLYVSFGISLRQLNMYVGALMSAINYPTNLCYFKKQLDEIQSFITIVISTGQC